MSGTRHAHRLGTAEKRAAGKMFIDDAAIGRQGEGESVSSDDGEPSNWVQ